MSSDREIQFSSPAPGILRFLPQVGLLVLLVAELLALTISFDTLNLDRVPAFWARVIGWTPQYLRVAITALGVTLLVSGKEIWIGLRDSDADGVRFRPRVLVVHILALILFAGTTAIVMGRQFAASPSRGVWALAWLCAGGATLAAWCLSAASAGAWARILARSRAGLLWGLGGGAAAWAAGSLAQESWRPLARYTFSAVKWSLDRIYASTVSDPSNFDLGTSTFSVNIAPSCSGYEGMGLIVTFLGVYLWHFRKDLQFPRALVLLPIGAGAAWILNVARIAALIVIGTSGWPDVALGGFHSQAGWLSFNAVGLGIVAIAMRGRYFMTDGTATRSTRPAHEPLADSTIPYLAPFLAIVATSMITGAFSAGFDWLYPARVLAAGAALWRFRKQYADVRWQWSWPAITIGAIAFLLWIALSPGGTTSDKDGWPAVLGAIPAGWAGLWVAIRLVGYVVTVPFAEELAFRGFLPRRLMRADFQGVPVTQWSWMPVLVSSILFGALHGRFWLAGTTAGLLFAVALYRGKALGDAVQAHATTNGLMVVYAVATGHWSALS